MLTACDVAESAHDARGRPGRFRAGGETSVGVVDDLILKPRGVAHAFWNAGDEPARLLEVITPSGFEGHFARLAEVMSGGGPPDVDLRARVTII